MSRIASIFLLQRLKGSTSGDGRDFNKDTWAVIFPAIQGAEGNSRHSDRNIRGIYTIVCHCQNWVDQFKYGDFSTWDAPRTGRPKTITTPKIIDHIHELISEDRRISAKSIDEQLGISRERVGSIIPDDLGMREVSAKWVPKCLNADEKCQRCQSSEQIWEFFRRDPNDFLSRLLTRTKPGYITMTRRQSDNQWIGSTTAHPAPKNSECKNPMEKFSPRFFGIKTTSSKSPNHQRGILLISAGAIEGHFEWKTPWKLHQCGLVLARQCPGSPVTCNLEETGLPGLPVSWLPTLFSGSGLVGLPPVPWTEKTIESSPFSCYAEVIAAAEIWMDGQPSEFFLSGLQKLKQQAKKCIELRGEYVE